MTLFGKMKVFKFGCLLSVLPAFNGASEIISAEKAMGGVENLQAILGADVVSFEKVTVPPVAKITGFESGHVKTEELSVNNWSWGMRLSVEKGPIAVPSSVAARLKKLLMSADVISDWKLGSRYYPTHRFELKEGKHILEIFVLETTGGFEVYRDGVRIGSHSGDNRIIRDLEDLLRRSRVEPEQPTQPTRG